MIAMYLGHFQAIDKESDVQTNIEESEDIVRATTKKNLTKLESMKKLWKQN